MSNNNDRKISQLPVTNPLTGSELVPVVQGGSAKKTTAADIANLASSNGGGVTSVNGDAGPAVVLDASDISAATAAQGAKADSAVQPGDLAAVATSGSYNDLSNKPSLGTASTQNIGAFATAVQGVKADSAVQPEDLAPVASSGQYADLSGIPTYVNWTPTFGVTSGAFTSTPTLVFAETLNDTKQRIIKWAFEITFDVSNGIGSITFTFPPFFQPPSGRRYSGFGRIQSGSNEWGICCQVVPTIYGVGLGYIGRSDNGSITSGTGRLLNAQGEFKY